MTPPDGADAASSPARRPLRLGFAGTPAFATRILAALIESRHAVAVVFTRPDRPAGRRRRLTPSAVRVFAEARGMSVYTPERFDGAERLLAGLDALIVAAFGIILPPAALAAPARGCLNVHASLLPRWRGAAPVERAIMAGDATTGVSIMQMDAGLDTGPVWLRREVHIDAADTATTLTARLAQAGAAALLDSLDRLDALTPTPQQPDAASYAPRITQSDTLIDWSRDAIDVERQVRALSGRQAARGDLTAPRQPAGRGAEAVRVNVLAARAAPAAAPCGELVKQGRAFAVGCGTGTLILDRVQLARGQGRPMAAADAANGFPDLFKPGARFRVSP